MYLFPYFKRRLYVITVAVHTRYSFSSWLSQRILVATDEVKALAFTAVRLDLKQAALNLSSKSAD